MKTRRLSFCEIILLKDDLAEVIIDEGVLLDLKMVKQYHLFLLLNLKAPFSLLINKKNSYTYTFEAQNEIGTLKEIAFMAVVVEGFNAKKSTEFLISMNSSKWNIKTFRFRNEALEWLENEN